MSTGCKQCLFVDTGRSVLYVTFLGSVCPVNQIKLVSYTLIRLVCGKPKEPARLHRCFQLARLIGPLLRFKVDASRCEVTLCTNHSDWGVIRPDSEPEHSTVCTCPSWSREELQSATISKNTCAMGVHVVSWTMLLSLSPASVVSGANARGKTRVVWECYGFPVATLDVRVLGWMKTVRQRLLSQSWTHQTRNPKPNYVVNRGFCVPLHP